MLKKKIKYTTFDGEEAEDIHYFNLSKVELIEMEVGAEGNSFKDWILRIVEQKNMAVLVEEFKKLILMSYGEKSDDGKRFVKSEELKDKFQQTVAFEALFMELITEEDAAAAFVAGLLPAEISIDEVKASTKEMIEKVSAPTPPVPPKP